MPKKISAKKPLIEIKNVVKTYGMDGVETHALRGISFDIHEGEFVAIIGQSGSGKSTLMNIMGLLDTITTGGYHFKGKNVTHYDEDQLAQFRNKEIGFVFQSFNLLARTTAVDNVRIPLVYAGVGEQDQIRESIKILTSVGLSERLEHMPNQLSGGQQQRVAIARALINKPSLILADEPTGNLDSASGIEIMKIFDRLNKEGHTVVLVTHESYIAAHANRVIELLDGEIVKDKKNGHRRKLTA
jgi:putative ABC transport system ATP-binding protein